MSFAQNLMGKGWVLQKEFKINPWAGQMFSKARSIGTVDTFKNMNRAPGA